MIESNKTQSEMYTHYKLLYKTAVGFMTMKKSGTNLKNPVFYKKFSKTTDHFLQIF